MLIEEIVVKAEGLEKTYYMGKVAVPALRGVNLAFKRGEFVVVMGSSGSGKTTLLNLIGALDKPTKGKVYIDGEDLTTLDEGKLTKIRRKKIGFVFQFYNLIPVLTAFENVELPMLISGKNKEDRRRRAFQLLEMMGLSDRSEHRPDELSGGEQQRVAIARSLANEPSIILADEPTGDLDTKTGQEVILALHDAAKKENVTVVVVTHDPVVTEKANRILEMRDGKIVNEKKRKKGKS
ncbi:MAG: ABC transporter ATP-binding protein [Candidatus Bathyarchaeota archaeon]|nr:ABC transporter ATP-binding protein [Candidatus Bathyarchaeota archaeon]MDH5664240.1 ABC transporter ATP-binding protein [Candidatus Bathyarchaeota archaeon]